MGINILVPGTILQNSHKKFEFLEIKEIYTNRRSMITGKKHFTISNWEWVKHFVRGEYVLYDQIVIVDGAIIEYNGAVHSSRNELPGAYFVILPSNQMYDELKKLLDDMMANVDTVAKKLGVKISR